MKLMLIQLVVIVILFIVSCMELPYHERWIKLELHRIEEYNIRAVAAKSDYYLNTIRCGLSISPIKELDRLQEVHRRYKGIADLCSYKIYSKHLAQTNYLTNMINDLIEEKEETFEVRAIFNDYGHYEDMDRIYLVLDDTSRCSYEYKFENGEIVNAKRILISKEDFSNLQEVNISVACPSGEELSYSTKIH